MVGRLIGAEDGIAHFAPDLAESVAFGDARYADIGELIRKTCEARGVAAPRSRHRHRSRPARRGKWISAISEPRSSRPASDPTTPAGSTFPTHSTTSASRSRATARARSSRASTSWASTSSASASRRPSWAPPRTPPFWPRGLRHRRAPRSRSSFASSYGSPSSTSLQSFARPPGRPGAAALGPSHRASGLQRSHQMSGGCAPGRLTSCARVALKAHIAGYGVAATAARRVVMRNRPSSPR